jgi:tetraacyldisaccharide 4'-kinase
VSGAPPRWLRFGLRPFSWFYGGAVRARNALFDARLRRVERVGVPVVSVGNLTVGGTGKTPLVMWLVETARQLGRDVGVLARGYGRARGDALNEEGSMLAKRFPGLRQVQDPDRVRGARRLVEQGVDVIVLDDGFQHRRLHRDRELVCVDARAALAEGALLPAGRLREPASGLRRAHLVVLTRAERLAPADLERRRRHLLEIGGPHLLVFAAEHAPRDVVAMPSGEVLGPETLRGRRVGLLSAIACPSAFEHTAGSLGAVVVWHERRRDHHRFTAAEIEQVAARARRDAVQLLVTEKDAPKLSARPVDHWVLRVDLRFLGEAPSPTAVGLG